MIADLPTGLLERAAVVAAEVEDLEARLAGNLRLFAQAVREAGLRDPIGGLSGDPIVDWSSVTVEGGVRFMMHDRDWDEVGVRLPAAWFVSPEAGVEHERRLLAEQERKAQQDRENRRRDRLAQLERERERLLAELDGT